MTPADHLQLERSRIELDKGYFLTPYRTAELSKISSKILATLTTSAVGMSYAECRYVLDLARNAIDTASGYKKEAPPDGDASDEAKAK